MNHLRLKCMISLMIILSYNSQSTIFYGSFTDSNKNVINALSPVRNQNQPVSCGASWAFAVASSISDQFNARKTTEFPEVVLSPQMLLTCASTEKNKTCDFQMNSADSDIEASLENLKSFGLSDESCNNWHANTDETCNNLTKCMDCANGENIHHEANCFSRDYHSYKLESWKKLTIGTEQQKDLVTTKTNVVNSLNNLGPVICNIQHSEALFHFQTSEIDIYEDNSGDDATYNTWVSLVGYIDSPKNTIGTKDVNNLWVVRLSFGDLVGRFGYIYLNADENKNPLGVLNNCYSVTINPVIEVIPNSSNESKFTGMFKPFIMAESFDIREPRFKFSTATYSKTHADNGVEDKSYEPIFWGNHDNKNYLTWVKNQHIPTYCGSCWAQAATSVLSDRLNIQNIRKGKTFPRHVLSVQAAINCALGGTCLGGDSGMLWQRTKTWKIPTETCRVYQAKNPTEFSCEGKSRCYNASKDNSWSIDKYNGLQVLEWKKLRGENQIKEALLDGPIACGFEVTDDFEKYKADLTKKVIYEEYKNFFEINHAISIVGWGIDENDSSKEYWIVRNSWGVEYGYNGMFYLRTGNILGMESGCAVPTKISFTNWDEQ